MVIWAVTLLLLLGWPPDRGRSLGLKLVAWAADPTRALPRMPPPLPRSLDDNGDAVAVHDAEEAEFYRVYAGSPLARWRMRLKTAGEPFDPSTERQGLVAIGVLGLLAVWRLDGRRQ